MNPILGETYDMFFEDGSQVQYFLININEFLDVFGTNMPSPSNESLHNLRS